jgi:hypothetical protein
VTRAMAAMSRVDSIFHRASIVLATSLMQPSLRRSGARSLRPLLNVLGEVGHFVNLANFDHLVVGHRSTLGPFAWCAVPSTASSAKPLIAIAATFFFSIVLLLRMGLLDAGRPSACGVLSPSLLTYLHLFVQVCRSVASRLMD